MIDDSTPIPIPIPVPIPAPDDLGRLLWAVGACATARRWAAAQPTPRAAWAACDESRWLAHLLARVDAGGRLAAAAACRLAAGVLALRGGTARQLALVEAAAAAAAGGGEPPPRAGDARFTDEPAADAVAGAVRAAIAATGGRPTLSGLGPALAAAHLALGGDDEARAVAAGWIREAVAFEDVEAAAAAFLERKRGEVAA